MAVVSLDRMAQGGIHDQIGGGFHRYSVDAQWLVPHFEKMLYDNALLARAYLEGAQAVAQLPVSHALPEGRGRQVLRLDLGADRRGGRTPGGGVRLRHLGRHAAGELREGDQHPAPAAAAR